MALLHTDKRAFGEDFLDDIVEWVAQNLTPDEIYTDAYLTTLEKWANQWAIDNGYTSKSDMDQWARDNGYTKS